MRKTIISISSSIGLSNDDHRVLNFLYQPLIGPLSYTLYLLLLNLGERSGNEYSKDFILDILNTNNVNFSQAKEKLEAIGLLDVYEKNDYLYLFLKPPFTPKQFLSDSILGKFLFQEIGETNYLKITEIFKKEIVNLEDFKNITKSFDDIFKVQSFNLTDTQQYKGKKNNFGLQFNSNFDYEIFINKLPKKYNRLTLTTFKMIDKVKQLAYVYEFKEEELATIYVQTHEKAEEFSFDLLEKTAIEYFLGKKENSEVSFSIKEKDPILEQVAAINRLSIKKLVLDYSTAERSVSLLADVNKLMTLYKVEKGVIKLLVIYLSKLKDKDIPNYRYLSKTLQTWVDKGIITTPKALTMNKEFLEYNKKTKYKKVETKASKRVQDFLEEIDEEWI